MKIKFVEDGEIVVDIDSGCSRERIDRIVKGRRRTAKEGGKQLALYRPCTEYRAGYPSIVMGLLRGSGYLR